MSQQCLPARSRATCTSIYAYGMETIRQTEDVDFALAVGDWSAFARLKQRLIDTGRFFEVPGAQQRLRHASDLPVDLVPFGGVEAADRQVAWPPGGEFRMSVFGFREALASCLRVRLPEGVETSVVSLPALALLKIIAWQDRHYRAPRKDALDLALIASNYLDLGNMDRLWNEFPAWKSPMPEQYSWPSLVKKDGNELFDHYRHTLEALGNQKGLLGLIFSKAQNKLQDPAKLRRLIVDLINKETWVSMSADVKGDAYEGLLEKNAQDTKSE